MIVPQVLAGNKSPSERNIVISRDIRFNSRGVEYLFHWLIESTPSEFVHVGSFYLVYKIQSISRMIREILIKHIFPEKKNGRQILL